MHFLILFVLFLQRGVFPQITCIPPCHHHSVLGQAEGEPGALLSSHLPPNTSVTTLFFPVTIPGAQCQLPVVSYLVLQLMHC